MTRGRLGLATLLAIVVVAAVPTPARAHGGGAPDASNFSSTVGGVVSVDADGDPVEPASLPDGVRWEVLANDALLQVANDTDTELTVAGYDGEPYLRLGPEGVWENRRSPAAYLNEDRYAETPVPDAAAATAEPEWVKVGDDPVHRWHDHRIHWMAAATLPPKVQTDPSVEQVVQEWRVPFTLASESLAVEGELRWVPAATWWPWLVAGTAVTGLPILGVAAVAARQGRRRRVLRAASVVLAIVAGLDLLHAIDDVVAMPATWGEDLAAFLPAAAFVALAGFGARAGWRGGDSAVTGVVIGAAALFGGVGMTHLPSLTSSQVVSVLPAGATRAVVAVNLGMLLPTVVAAWYAPERPSPAGVAAETYADADPAVTEHG